MSKWAWTLPPSGSPRTARRIGVVERMAGRPDPTTHALSGFVVRTFVGALGARL